MDDDFIFALTGRFDKSGFGFSTLNWKLLRKAWFPVFTYLAYLWQWGGYGNLDKQSLTTELILKHGVNP